MKYPLYAIRDNKVGFMMPTVDQSDQSAIRNFSYAINGEGVMNFSPNDFDLFKIGEFDSESGEITSKVPELISNGYAVVNAK